MTFALLTKLSNRPRAVAGHRFLRSVVAAVALCTGVNVSAQTPAAQLTIDPAQIVTPVSPMLYGMMTEEINHALDGGLYAELVQNRTFRASWEGIQLARNMGQGKFVDVSGVSGNVFSQRWVGRGMAIGDLDNDGRLDAVVTTNGGPAYVLKNETATKNHWLTLSLVGHKSNRDAIGAEIKVVTSSGPQFWTVSTAGSYLSSNDKRAHFGLGADATARSIEIRWPSGIRQTLSNVAGDRIVKIDEPAPQTGEKAGVH